MTDANLFLGRLLPEYFPAIFGPNEDEPLDYETTARAFAELTTKINEQENMQLTPEEVASGFLRVANESMGRPIRSLTEGRGIRTSSHTLVSFGGAGGQHACDVADALGIEKAAIHRFSSILSAYGIALGDITHEVQLPRTEKLSVVETRLLTEFQPLMDDGRSVLSSQGVSEHGMNHELYLNLRYAGTNSSLMIQKPRDSWDFAGSFVHQHREEFGFVLDRDILVDDIRVRAIGKTTGQEFKTISQSLQEASINILTSEKSVKKTGVYTAGAWHDVHVYNLDDLEPGDRVHGPAIILDQTQTILVQPNWHATALPRHLLLEKEAGSPPDAATNAVELSDDLVDPIQLSVFGHRFMSIAEQMGRSLEKTSVSINIKERLDYSCAIFSASGGLVANAPHIPCHLGAMSFAVTYQAEKWGNRLMPGDVLVSNHPVAGGSHLPDVNVITPVIDEDTNEVLFWVASRAHHADIGGISAGSMPPHSKEIWQEGASFTSFKLVEGGRFNEEELREIMLIKPASYPGCTGTRTWSDNVSDLKAQVAANLKGIRLIKECIKEYGLGTVQVSLYPAGDSSISTYRH